MKIKFLGASGTVTGSSYILTSQSGQAILIDLGMFQGPEVIEKLNYEKYDYDCSKLIGVVLTHAHLDHCGRLPILLSGGFTGSIWMTPATRDLTELSLLDAAKVSKNDNKHNKDRILYDKDQAIKTISFFKTINYHIPFKIGDFSLKMLDAGHLLGSASIEIEDTSATSQYKKIVFSGDVGNYPEALLAPTEFVNNADVVVMESTYGDRIHAVDDPINIFQSEINAIEKSGGTLLIPAFSLDRTQEVLHIIGHLKRSEKILRETMIYLDSPMAEKATIIYEEYPNLFNTHIQEDLKVIDPFQFSGLSVVAKHGESREIWDDEGPKVIIAGSGMMVGGRITMHAAHYLPIDTTRLLIVGYQAEGTLGRMLQNGAKQVHVEGQNVSVKAKINKTEGMSSHADQPKLLEWLKNIKGVRKVFLTHGDDVPRKTLAGKINEELGITDIILPVQNQEVSI